MFRFITHGTFLWLLTLVVLVGCGESEATIETTADSPELGETGSIEEAFTETSTENPLPTANLNEFDEFGLEEETYSPEKGSPEWLLLEIRALRLSPVSPDGTADEVEISQNERHRQIVEMATEMISLIHTDPEKEEIFNEAVKLLMESQLQLALLVPEEVDALYANREMLYRRAPKSKAAAEAAFVVARFAHTRALEFAKREPRWLEEYSRQARSFAINFPNEDARAVSLLYSAGRSCELNGRGDEAIACYTQLRENFPESPQAQQISAVLRRLNLKGKPVQIAGDTLDGKRLTIDQLAGKAVLVIFWASDNPQFQIILPQLIEVANRYEKHGLAVIGINLDEDQIAVEEFIKDQSINWPQLFDSNPEKRRWKHDVVKYYGVRNIPLLWLVDQQGIVANPQVEPDQLEQEIRSLLTRNAKKPNAKKSPR